MSHPFEVSEQEKVIKKNVVVILHELFCPSFMDLCMRPILFLDKPTDSKLPTPLT